MEPHLFPVALLPALSSEGEEEGCMGDLATGPASEKGDSD